MTDKQVNKDPRLRLERKEMVARLPTSGLGSTRKWLIRQHYALTVRSRSTMIRIFDIF